MSETEQKTPTGELSLSTAEKKHEELVAPFEDIKEEDFFEKDLNAPKEDDYNEEDVPEREYIPMPSIFEPIPEEAQKEILSKFALKKREKEEVTSTTAQRLVNQFRALSAFRSDYVLTYNKELMTASDEVINYLPHILGGAAVREYLDYLLAQKKQGREFDQDNIDFSITNDTGYLPSPEGDFATSEASDGTKAPIDATVAQGQTQTLSKLVGEIQKANEAQTKALNDSVQALKTAIETAPTGSNRLTRDDIEAIVDGQRKIMSEAMEKFMLLQARAFSDTVEELNRQTELIQAQFRPVGAVRQAMSSLKAATQKKDEKEEKEDKSLKGEKPLKAEKEETPKTDTLPLLKEVVKEETPAPVTHKKPKKEAKSTTKPTVQIDDGEYEILTEFDIQSD